MSDLRLNDPFISHRPGKVCEVFEQHLHMSDGSILTPGDIEQPTMHLRPLLFWLVVGAGLWAVIIAAILKVVRG